MSPRFRLVRAALSGLVAVLLLTAVAGGVTVDPDQGSTFVPLTPARLLDSRFGTGGLSGPFQRSIPRTFQVTGNGGVPLTAAAVTGNLTSTGSTLAGFAYIGPDPLATPPSSSLNFPAGDTRANGVTVDLSDTGTLSITLSGPVGITSHFIFDVTGYYIPSSGPSLAALDGTPCSVGVTPGTLEVSVAPPLGDVTLRCVPEEVIYAVAWTNTDGLPGFDPEADVLIAKLVEGPGVAQDGVPGAGDEIVVHQYPKDFDFASAGFGSFTVTTFVATAVFPSALPGGGNSVQANVGTTASFGWHRGSNSTPTSFFETWGASTQGPGAISTGLTDYHYDPGVNERIDTEPLSPVAPEDTIHASRSPSAADDAFLDVAIFLP